MGYRAIAEWSDGWWAVHVEGHPGVWTQARRLEQVPEMAADALSMALDAAVSPADVEVDATPPDKSVSLAVAMKDAAQEASVKASAAMRVAVRALAREGMTVRDIGRLIGVSHQRAAVLASEIRDEVVGKARKTAARSTKSGSVRTTSAPSGGYRVAAKTATAKVVSRSSQSASR